MAARSHRLAGPTVLETNDFEQVFLVPESYVAIVKSVRVVNLTEGPVVVDACENVGDAAHAFFWQETVPAGAIVLDSSWWVMQDASELLVRCNLANAINVWMSGALLPE